VLRIVINKLFEEKRLKRENIVLRKRLKERHKYDQLVGISLKMQEIYEQTDHMSSGSPNVLIQGESGTGKELTAHVIHRNSDRSRQAFIPVNCKSFGKGIAGDQLYNHAVELFKSAQAATVFFNEIAEIKLAVQAVISQAYTENDFNPGPGDGKAGSSVRLLAATNRNLGEAAQKGNFNQDFLSCISDVKIIMPPLRERREDICLLINHFLNRYNAKNENKVMNISPDALDVLLRYNWPGNVIQLENVIERAFALRVDLTIEVDDLPSEIKTFEEISKIS
jgi:DNA-binding NtrC family response regulator